MQLISILSLFLLLTSKVQIGLQEDDNGNGDDGDAGDDDDDDGDGDDGDADDGDDGDRSCQCANDLGKRPTDEDPPFDITSCEQIINQLMTMKGYSNAQSVTTKTTTTTIRTHTSRPTLQMYESECTQCAPTTQLEIEVNRSQITLLLLGATLGLAVLLLVMVTIGWVWTCWRMKRGQTVKGFQSNSVYYKETCVNRNKNAYNYEERKVEKPTYEETSTSQQYAGFDNVAGTSTFRTLYARVEPAPEETEVGGQAYDVLIHGEQSNGKNEVMNRDPPKDYRHLGSLN